MTRVAGSALLVVLVAAPRGALAQAPILVDRVVAVVGAEPILWSQLDEEIASAQAQGQKLPDDSAGRVAMRRRILNNLVETELLVQQAERDTSVKVTEQEVQEAVEQTVKNVRNRFGSEQEFQNQLKLAAFGGVEEWRRWLTEQQRRQILQQRLIENLRQRGKIKPIPPTDGQMRAYWEENRTADQRRPATVSFRQIIVVPQPDSVSRALALHKADSLLDALRKGAEFTEVARRFSDDTATRDSGGSLGWFRRGVMVKNFEAVAFRLRPGDLSYPVETVFGFHIIQVQRVQPAEVLARHILIAPTISQAQIAAARARADTVHDQLARHVSFDSLAARYGDENAPKLAEAVPLTQLSPEYQQLVARDSTVGLKPVVEVNATSARPQFAVIEVTNRQGEGPLTYEDVRERIRGDLSQQLGVEHYLDQLRRLTYIDIRL